MRQLGEELAAIAREGSEEISKRIARIREIDRAMGATINKESWENWRDIPPGKLEGGENDITEINNGSIPKGQQEPSRAA